MLRPSSASRPVVRSRHLLLVGWAGLLLTGGCSKAPADDRDHILLISIDTLRPDRLGCYGHDRDTSPTLDRLAAEGVVFEDVTSASPWTLPSHASLLTGLYPSRHGVKTHTRRLPDTVPTLASLLAAEGYATAAVVNSHNVSERYGLEQGFESFQYVKEYGFDGTLPNKAPKILKRATKMLDKRGDRPLFMFLHFYDVHTDFVVAPEYRDQFVRPYSGELDGSTAQLGDIRLREERLDEADVRFLFDMYDAEIRQLDDLLAGFFELLDERGLLDDMLVAIVSDHGEEFMEHGSVLHGRTYYQEIVRIPWILRGPGIPAGARIAAPVHLVDVAPTLLALVGVDAADADMNGIGLVELLHDQTASLPDRFLFSEADHNNVEPDIRRLVRSPRYKLLYDRLTDRAVLFDIEGDPAEQRDLFAQETELATLLMARLEAFMAGETEAETIEAPSEDVLEALEKLGY